MVKIILLTGALAMSAILTASTIASAQSSAPGMPLNEAQLCASFRPAGNGCWRPTSTVTITARGGQVAYPAGSVICAGEVKGGVDIATALNRRCTRQ